MSDKEILDLLRNLVYIKGEDGSLIPSYCFIEEFLNITGLDIKEAVETILENGFKLYKTIPTEDIDETTIIAAKECPISVIIENYETYFGVDVDIVEITSVDEFNSVVELVESYLLTEDIETMKKYYPNIPDDKFMDYIKLDPTYFNNDEILEHLNSKSFIAYHGSQNPDIRSFDKSQNGSYGEHCVFFTDNKTLAKLFTYDTPNGLYTCKLSPNKLLVVDADGTQYNSVKINGKEYGHITEVIKEFKTKCDCLQINNILEYNGNYRVTDYLVFDTDIITILNQENLSVNNKKSNTELKENLRKMVGKEMYVTSSPNDVMNYLKNTDQDIRILYDSNLDLYFLCYGDDYIHYDMIKQAEKEGYYYKLEDFIDRLGTINNYIDYGVNGGYVGEDGEEFDWIDPYLYYIIFDPTGTWEVGMDDYDEKIKTSIGNFLTRDCNIEEIDLYKKIKDLQIKESKNTIDNSETLVYNSDIKQKERGNDSMKKKDIKSKKTEIKTKDNLMEEIKEDTEMSKEELMNLILTTLPLVKFEDLSEEELNNWE